MNALLLRKMQNVNSIPTIEGYTTYTKHVWTTEIVATPSSSSRTISSSYNADGPVNGNTIGQMFKAASVEDIPRSHDSIWIWSYRNLSASSTIYPIHPGNNFKQFEVVAWYNSHWDVGDKPSSDESLWYYTQLIHLQSYINYGYRYIYFKNSPNVLYELKSATVNSSDFNRPVTISLGATYTIKESFISEPHEIVLTKDIDKYPDNDYYPERGTEAASNTFYYKKVS